MGRVGTANGNLGMWVDEENPGAGSQIADSTGLNGNWWKIDKLFIEHAADGTHKSNIIDKGNLKTTVADGTTIELNGTVGLRAKDDGISGQKIAYTIVDGTTLEATATSGAKTFRVKDHGLTAAKLSQDNNARKTHYSITGTYTKGAGEGEHGICITRDAYVTKITSFKDDDLTVGHDEITYGTSGYHITANTKLSVSANATDVGEINIYNAGSLMHQIAVSDTTSAYHLVIEVENDD